ncbi:MAG: hypothetical protein ACP5QX_03525 [Caldisericaceae bacterium]
MGTGEISVRKSKPPSKFDYKSIKRKKNIPFESCRDKSIFKLFVICLNICIIQKTMLNSVEKGETKYARKECYCYWSRS